MVLVESCGDGVVATQMTFQLSDGDSIPTSPLQFQFRTISAMAACTLNYRWHSRFPEIQWSNVVRNKRYICYAAKYEGVYFAVAIWSSPIAGNRFNNAETILELRRMAICEQAPRNTASRMLSHMRKDINKKFPEIRRLISYQDTEVHSGTIYKASGWTMINTMSTEVDWGTNGRQRTRPQSSAPKVRWEYAL